MAKKKTTKLDPLAGYIPASVQIFPSTVTDNPYPQAKQKIPRYYSIFINNAAGANNLNERIDYLTNDFYCTHIYLKHTDTATASATGAVQQGSLYDTDSSATINPIFKNYLISLEGDNKGSFFDFSSAPLIFKKRYINVMGNVTGAAMTIYMQLFGFDIQK